MKICFVSNLYPPNVVGGAEFYVEKVVKKLAENQQNKIIVITANQKFSWRPKIEEKNNLKIYRLWPLNLYSLTTKKKYPIFLKMLWHLIDLWHPLVYFSIKKILKKEKPDFVHTHNLAGFSFSVFSAVKKLGIKIIHTCHDYYLLCPYANLVCPLTGWRFRKLPPFFCRWYRKITRRILKNKVDLVLTPSKFVMETHLANGFFNNSQQHILPLGIERSNCNSSVSVHRPFKILCVSQLAKHKGVGTLIKAFTLMRNEQLSMINYQLTIVGDGSERKNLEKLAGDNKNIIFTGKLKSEELENKYQEADLVVVPSLAPETFSLVLFEAMSFGKPVIASHLGALAEYIKDNQNGFLFEPGNVDQLKKILEKVINDPDLIKKTGQNAFQFAQDFTFEKHWEKLGEIYKNY
ncbi:MAG: glycosyltransferase family 4 protein [Ignavibacterium sp.]|nr:glycosyltransferase family 4 protein [Ignavibacterium sp.]